VLRACLSRDSVAVGSIAMGSGDDGSVGSGSGAAVLPFPARGPGSGDHLLRRLDALLDLDMVRKQLEPFYSEMGRRSVDPELMIRMLLIALRVHLSRSFRHQINTITAAYKPFGWARRTIRSATFNAHSLPIMEQSTAAMSATEGLDIDWPEIDRPEPKCTGDGPSLVRSNMP
jgi:hypothetical protein